MSTEQRAVIEMGGGAILVTLGVFLAQLPLPGLPDMNHILLHLGIASGFTIIICGIVLFIVGAARFADSRWPVWLVKRWDLMWTKRFAIHFFPLCITVILGIAFLLDAHAQGNVPAPTNNIPAAPSLNGRCNTYIGRDNTGPINPDCRTYNYGPPRRPLGLYQNGEKIGGVEAIVDYDNFTNKISLSNFFIDGNNISFAQPFELGDILIHCASLDKLPVGMFHNTINLMGNTICDVVGKRNAEGNTEGK